MPRTRQISVVDKDHVWDETPQSVASVKFDLYVKSRELKQISDSLKRILTLPSAERSLWINDHESVISELMESFMEDSVLAMDGLQLDQESMQLSVELVTQMRDAMNMIHTIFAEEEGLLG